MKIPVALLMLVFCTALAPALAQRIYNYSSNTANIPFVTKKKDGSLTLELSWPSAQHAFEIQGTYSPREHILLMFNHFNAISQAIKREEQAGTSCQLSEFGAGIYKQMRKGTASLVAGYGRGSLFSYYGNSQTAAFNIQRWFLQPSLFFVGKDAVLGLGFRLTSVKHTKGNIDYAIDEYYLYGIQQIEKGSPFFLPEICIKAGFKVNPLFFLLNVNAIFPDVDRLNFSQGLLGLSVQWNFGKKGVE